MVFIKLNDDKQLPGGNNWRSVEPSAAVPGCLGDTGILAHADRLATTGHKPSGSQSWGLNLCPIKNIKKNLYASSSKTY